MEILTIKGYVKILGKTQIHERWKKNHILITEWKVYNERIQILIWLIKDLTFFSLLNMISFHPLSTNVKKRILFWSDCYGMCGQQHFKGKKKSKPKNLFGPSSKMRPLRESEFRFFGTFFKQRKMPLILLTKNNLRYWSILSLFT